MILRDVPRLVRIHDDMCAYDSSIEESFWHTWDILAICALNGIVINEIKFQFCCRTVEFAGLSISATAVQPSQRLITAIHDFPRPNDITKARAWFGIVNQVQWAYANSPAMAPFRALVKPKTIFAWNENLEALFKEAKNRIISQVKDGVKSYDVTRPTCIQTDWSKEGIGYLLLQKYCSCPMEKASVCCHEGWQLVFAGSRFTRGAEPRYSPTEGEALAVAWALNHAHLFTKGCPKILVSTDHLPLLGIFNNKPFDTIKNPRLLRLKEHTIPFDFYMQYNKGKWHRAPDALSRNPVAQTYCLELFYLDKASHSLIDDIGNTDTLDIASAQLAAYNANSEDVTNAISMADLKVATDQDETLQELMLAISNGFPATHSLTSSNIRQFFNVRENLWIEDGIIMFKERLVIPAILRKKILNLLHSAHQGVEGMRARATTCVYWPGMNADIRNRRKNCQYCNEIAPRQSKEPLNLIPPAEYPFQQICADCFVISGRTYLSVVDRYSGWPLIFHYGRSHPDSDMLISNMRSIFSVYGAPEIFISDGGPPFQSRAFTGFLRNWGVASRLSSARYSQSNGRAELGVKTAKRTIEENTGRNGSLNTDKVCQAFLQYRNTPLQGLGLSPSQLLFHRRLRDCFPSKSSHLKPHSEWIEAGNQREQAFYKRNQRLIEEYDRTAHSLPVLDVGTTVLVQDGSGRHRWNRTGNIVDVCNRKYTIRMHGSGRIVTRNRRFIKPCLSLPYDGSLLVSPVAVSPPVISNQENNIIQENSIHPIDTGSTNSNARQSYHQPIDNNGSQQPQESSRLPAMLKRILPYNQPGLKE